MDFTHFEAHWSYTDFHDFRCKLAACIGKNALYLVEGMELAHQQNEPIGLI